MLFKLLPSPIQVKGFQDPIDVFEIENEDKKEQIEIKIIPHLSSIEFPLL